MTRGSGPLSASFFHARPSHDQRSLSTPLLFDPPKMIVWPRFESNAAPAPARGGGPDAATRVHDVPSNSHVSSRMGVSALPTRLPIPPKTTARLRFES